MILVSLHNPTDQDIKDYPIEEADLDADGKIIIIDNKIKTTGRTLTWSIMAGETLKFPEYVADYLLGIYGFLEKGGTESEPTSTVSTPAEAGKDICKHCGQSFKGKKALALHIAARHPEEL